jgi:hypothetical protein
LFSHPVSLRPLDTPVTIHAAVSAKQNVKEVVEFYRCIYDELIDTVEESRRSADQGMGFDKYDTASLLSLMVAAAFILLPVLLR